MPVPDPGDPATVEPVKSTVAANAVALVRQFEVVPPAAVSRRGDAKVRPITSDYELEFFRQEYDGWVFSQGVAHIIRGAWRRVSGDGKHEVTATFTEKIIAVSGGEKPAFNHIAGGRGRRHWIEGGTVGVSSAVAGDLILLAPSIAGYHLTGERNRRLAANLGIDLVANVQMGTQRLIGGVALQQSRSAQGSALDLGTAALWGMPFFSRFALNADAVYRRVLLGWRESYEWDTDALEYRSAGRERIDYRAPFMAAPHSLALGVSATFMVSDFFGLNAGYRTQLLIEDLRIRTLLVGGRFAF